MAGSEASQQKPKGRAKRLPQDDRREQIIEGAVAYFSEVGFEGSTRGLAKRLGITQPLLYRYFPTKDDLVQAVYDHLFIGSWRDEWSDAFIDTGISLRDRLIAFYLSYTKVIFDPRWIRIYLFSGLKGLEINRWWMTFVERNVMRRVCGEIRRENGLPDFGAVPLTATEVEAFWTFHGGIFYFGVRCEVYGTKPRLDRMKFIEVSVDSLLTGLPAVVQAELGRM